MGRKKKIESTENKTIKLENNNLPLNKIKNIQMYLFNFNYCNEKYKKFKKRIKEYFY